MKTRRVKLILGGCLLALTITGFAGCFSSIRAEAYTVNLSQDLAYSFGETFVIPEATIEYDGENVPATKVVLVDPNGVMIEGNSHLLQTEGVYKIIYYATVSGKVISAEKTFQVVNDTAVNLKPTITLDPRFSENSQFKIAVNESVIIPRATATDDNLVGDVNVIVYYNYGTQLQQIIGLENDVFTPTKVGEHAIVYSTVDIYGERTEEVVYVSCAISEDNVALKMTAEDATRNAGEEVEIAPCELVGLYNDYSNVRVFAVFEGETEREEIFNYRYFPRKVGNYQIIYEYETPFKTYSTTSCLTTLAVGNIELNRAPLPKYFIKDARYTLDDWVGYVFDEKYPVRTVAKAYMKEDDGVYEEINHRDFKINASSSVAFKFEIGSKFIETEQFDVVDVGFGGSLNLKEYFQGDGFIKGENEALFAVEEGTGNYTLDFINVLSLSTFSFEFTVPKTDDTDIAYDELQAIDVTVTDYYNREKTVTARYENNGGTLVLSLNGGVKTNTGRVFTGVKNNFFYNGGAFSDASGVTWAWDDSFNCDKILLSVTFIGVDGDAGITVQRLGSQGFNATSDRIEADIYYKDSQSGIHEIGEVVNLSAAQITDVLSPYLEKNHKFVVTAPNGSYVTSLDGVLLDGSCDVTRSYQIKLESLGSYLVKYIYEDQNGNPRTSYYGINVPERNKPTIVLEGVNDGDLVKAKTNSWFASLLEKLFPYFAEDLVNTKDYSWVTVAEYSVSDDLTPAEDLISYVVVYDPDYLQVTIQDGKFAAFKKGEYTVCYYCYDSEGNCNTVSYTVCVD